MAKKEKNKDYSVGGGKKWVVGFALLALLAVVVTVLLTTLSPNTGKLTNYLNTISTSSYMTSSSDKLQYDIFEKKVANASKANNYIKTMATEMAVVQQLSTDVALVVDFYNDNIMFANQKGALGKKYKKIMSGFDGVRRSQTKLNEIVEKAVNLKDNASTYLQSAWVDFREEYLNWFDYNKKAIDGLREAYHNGLGNTTINNIASKMILDTAYDYMHVISYEIKANVDYDKENPNATSYEYVAGPKISAFTKFVRNNIKNTDKIREYYFDETIRENFEELELFYNLYLEPNLQNVISSIEMKSDTEVVTKTYQGIVDSNGIYNKIKAFVVGG